MGSFLKKGVDQLIWSKPVIVILSILLSLFIWLFAVDPVKTITFSIPIKTVALSPEHSINEERLIVMNQDIPDTAEITIVGRTSYIEALKLDKYYATLDFTSVTTEGNKTLSLEGPFGGALNGIKVLAMTPSQYAIQVDKLSDSIVQSEVRIMGAPKAGYKIITQKIVPINIQLIGSEALLKKAAKAVVDVDVTDIEEGFEETKYVKIIDENGIEIKGTERQYKVKVTIEVAKEVKVMPVMQGMPPNGFSILGTPTISPEYVLLKGSKTMLNQISQVYTKPINISGLTESTVFDGELDLQSYKGVVVYDRNNKVKVSVQIEGAISRQIEIPTTLLQFTNTNSKLKYSANASSIIFKVNGSSNIVNAINEVSLVPTVDVKGLGVGTHLLTFTAVLPADCTFDGKHEVLVNVEKNSN